MTATNNRPARTASGLLPFLPLALIISMFGVAVLLAQVAPSRVTSGVYQVIVGEGTAQFILATESLACSRSGDIVTCTAPVAGQQLTVDFKYSTLARRYQSALARPVTAIARCPASPGWVFMGTPPTQWGSPTSSA